MIHKSCFDHRPLETILLSSQRLFPYPLVRSTRFEVLPASKAFSMGRLLDCAASAVGTRLDRSSLVRWSKTNLQNLQTSSPPHGTGFSVFGWQLFNLAPLMLNNCRTTTLRVQEIFSLWQPSGVQTQPFEMHLPSSAPSNHSHYAPL